MAENVDIVVTESGTDQAAQKINDLGQAADEAAKKVDSANSSLTFLKDTSAAVTAPIESMAQAAAASTNGVTLMNDAISASQSLLQQQQAAADRAGISLEEMQARTEAFRNGTDQLSQAVGQNTEETKKHGEATEEAAKHTEHFAEAGNLLKEVLTLVGLALSTEQLIEYSNAYEKVSDQLSTVSANMQELHGFEERLLEISQQTGSSFEKNVDSFQKLSTSTKGLNISQEDLLQTILGVDNAVRISGGSSQDAARALDVFQRALATGQVEGRQFRQLLQQFPALGQAVARGLNEPISALTSFSQKSPLAAKEFIEAFNKTSETAVQVGSTIRLSFESSIVVLRNAVTSYVGQLNEASGATNALASIVLFLANNLNTIATVVRVTATAWLSYYAILVAFPAAIGLITRAVTSLTVAIAANPLGFLIVAITTSIALIFQFGDAIRLTSDGSISLLGAMIGTWDFLRNSLLAVYNVVSTVLGPAFRAVGFIIQGVFLLAIQAVRAFINVLSLIIPISDQTKQAFADLATPFILFKDSLVGSMTEATAKLDETGEHTKTLAELLGGDDAGSLAGSTERATKSVNTLSGSVENLTQMGRVNASLIPVFTGAYDQMVAAHQRASEAAKAYAEDVRAEQEAMKELALVSRNAFGEMIKASDEWALRSGANFNAVKNHAESTGDTLSSTASATRSSSSSGSSSDDFGGGGISFGGRGNSFSSTMYVNPALELAGLANMGARDVPDWLADWFGGAISNAAQQKEAIAKFQKSAGVPTFGGGMPAFAQGGAFDVGGSGGTDSQLVQFYATPGERVTVETPSQRSRSQEMHPNGKTIVVNMKVVTPDADSFRRSQTQNLLTLKSKLGQI